MSIPIPQRFVSTDYTFYIGVQYKMSYTVLAAVIIVKMHTYIFFTFVQKGIPYYAPVMTNIECLCQYEVLRRKKVQVCFC